VQIWSDRDDGVKNILQRNGPDALPSNECLTAQASQVLLCFVVRESEKKIIWCLTTPLIMRMNEKGIWIPACAGMNGLNGTARDLHYVLALAALA
jgi:hypothetical protein